MPNLRKHLFIFFSQHNYIIYITLAHGILCEYLNSKYRMLIPNIKPYNIYLFITDRFRPNMLMHE